MEVNLNGVILDFDELINKLSQVKVHSDITCEYQNGHYYYIKYMPELSRTHYTRRHVYRIITGCESYDEALEAVELIMNDGSWREDYYKSMNQQNPSIANSLHSYHKFSYNEETDEYTYELVIPYDD